MAGGDRRGRAAVEDRPFRRGHMHRAEGPFIVRHLGVDRRFHGKGGITTRVVEHHVDTQVTLRRRARKVDVDIFIFDGDRHIKMQRLFKAIAPDYMRIVPIG